MNNKLIKLDAVRALCILCIVICHTIDLPFLVFAQEAIIILFILSGFVIELSWSKSKDKSFKTYFFKRFLRIYIPVVLVIGINILLFSIDNNQIEIGWLTIIGNIFMLQELEWMRPNVIVNPIMGICAFSTLSYIWWIYMLYYPLVTFFKEKSSLIVYALGIIAALIYTIYPFFVNRLFLYLAIWWSGVDMARLYSNGKSINIKNLKSVLLTLFTITIIVSSTAYFKYNGVKLSVYPLLEVRNLGFSLVAIVVAIVWNKLKWTGFSVLNIFARVAPISFGLFIIHMILLAEATYLDIIVNNRVLRYTIYVLVWLGIGYLIEKVVYAKLNKFILKK